MLHLKTRNKVEAGEKIDEEHINVKFEYVHVTAWGCNFILGKGDGERDRVSFLI